MVHEILYPPNIIKNDDTVREIHLHILTGMNHINEELHSFYRSPNIVRVIKSRRLRWAGHLSRMEEGMCF